MTLLSADPAAVQATPALATRRPMRLSFMRPSSAPRFRQVTASYARKIRENKRRQQKSRALLHLRISLRTQSLSF
jgi:hypothetical protein